MPDAKVTAEHRRMARAWLTKKGGCREWVEQEIPDIAQLLADVEAPLKEEIAAQRTCRLANEAELMRADAMIGRLKSNLAIAVDALRHIATQENAGTSRSWAIEALKRIGGDHE